MCTSVFKKIGMYGIKDVEPRKKEEKARTEKKHPHVTLSWEKMILFTFFKFSDI